MEREPLAYYRIATRRDVFKFLAIGVTIQAATAESVVGAGNAISAVISTQRRVSDIREASVEEIRRQCDSLTSDQQRSCIDKKMAIITPELERIKQNIWEENHGPFWDKIAKVSVFITAVAAAVTGWLLHQEEGVIRMPLNVSRN